MPILSLHVNSRSLHNKLYAQCFEATKDIVSLQAKGVNVGTPHMSPPASMRICTILFFWLSSLKSLVQEPLWLMTWLQFGKNGLLFLHANHL